jgi:hypothetical protein
MRSESHVYGFSREKHGDRNQGHLQAIETEGRGEKEKRNSGLKLAA